jgi:hypothetical protein
VIAHGQTLAFRNPRDLLVGEPAAFIELLETVGWRSRAGIS